MYTLYPSIKTFATHKISVTPPHILHIEECGNPNGIPILICHSGPGTGCEAFHRRFFCPETFRIILFDQRGAGRSSPHAFLENNTTDDLLSDMELIREQLNVTKWYLFGSAWGSTLSLLYAEQFPQNVLGLILNCTFLARKKDIDWFYQYGANVFFPEHWEEFTSIIDKSDTKNIIDAYAKKLNGKDEVSCRNAAKHWALWQANCFSLHPHQENLTHFTDPHFALSLARLETHYFSNHCFIKENQLLNNIKNIRHLPMYLIHGRYDIVSPLESAWLIHQACPRSKLVVVRDAGHSLKEPGIIDAVILAGKNILSQEPPTAC